MLYALVMAGGAGTRFWPESRADFPKQLLNLAGERTLLQATMDRLSDLVPQDRVIVATAARLAKPVSEQLPHLRAESLIAEPCKRDTAPCIGLAAVELLARDPMATMLVCPSDHLIKPASEFRQAVQLAEQLIEEDPERLATFGIKPTYPAESFGYIERGEPLSGIPRPYKGYTVSRFHEKPKAERAREYLDSGHFYWNSGIFVWRAATIRDALAKGQPEMLKHLEAIAAARGRANYEEVLAAEFAAIRPISIDYAVLEHSRSVVMLEAPFEWDDLGSWQALGRLLPADSSGNVVTGNHIGLETHDSIIRAGNKHLVVTLGVRDLIIVHTPDATLVANKHDEESIRHLSKLLAERGYNRYL
jgi:mannose-1-phosphate guanylyltransferase